MKHKNIVNTLTKSFLATLYTIGTFVTAESVLL